MYLKSPLEGESYSLLLATLAPFAQFVGFTVESLDTSLSADAIDLIASLSPWLVSVEQVNQWPGTRNFPPDRLSARYLYGCEAEVVRLLIAAAVGLYSWVSPALPENLHLLRDDRSILLASVSQEEIAWVEMIESELGILTPRISFLADSGENRF